MRLFFAVPLSPPLQTRIASWRDALRLPSTAARVSVPNLHLTVAFLGDIEPERVPPLLDIGARVAARITPSELVFNRVNCWNNGVLHLAPAGGRGGRGGHGGHGSGGRGGKGEGASEWRGGYGYRGAAQDGAQAQAQAAQDAGQTAHETPPEGIYALAAALKAELDASQFPTERRAYRAHLTLARQAERVQARARFRVPVNRVVLYSSEVGVGYRALGEWELVGGRVDGEVMEGEGR